MCLSSDRGCPASGECRETLQCTQIAGVRTRPHHGKESKLYYRVWAVLMLYRRLCYAMLTHVRATTSLFAAHLVGVWICCAGVKWLCHA
jgi:hypothetical protein